jgi:hypothetical protein
MKMPFEKLPQWKDENPTIYRKAQLKTKITKLQRKDPLKQNPDIQAKIGELTYEYVKLINEGK